MAFYSQILHFKEESFKQLTGVKRSTFGLMVASLKESELKLHKRRGRRAKLPIEDRLLMTLEYLREYRTLFHIAADYGVSRSSAGKTINWVEKELSKIPEFHLPGKKALKSSDLEYEVFIVDATESPIERPKRSREKKES